MKSKASKYISIDALNDLNSKTARRRFFGAFLILALLNLLLFWASSFIDPQNMWGDFIKSVSANLFSAAATVLVVYGAYIIFIQEDIERPEIETIRPGDISDEIEGLREDTTFYFLWARSATYFRAETLQALSQLARRERKTVDITVLLPDPEIPQLSDAYEGMVSALGEKDGKEKLFNNAVATSAACAIVCARNRNVRVKVCLSKFLPSFRIDMSEAGAILTEDDKSLYGLKFSRKSQFFDMYRNMIICEEQLSRMIDLNAYDWRLHDLTDEDIPIEALLSFGFSSERIRSNRDQIFSIIAPNDHRYK